MTTAVATGSRARRRRVELPPWQLLGPTVVVALVALAPIWYLVDQALDRGWGPAIEEVAQRRTVDLVVRSTALAGFVTLATVLVGAAAAWIVARSDLPGRRVLRVAFAMPLAVPSYLSAFAWVSWDPSIAGFWGAALVLVATSYPYVYLPVVAALGRIDPAQEEIARSLGWGEGRIAVGLTLRQARPAVLAGALLVAQYAYMDFGAVATMRYEAFTWVVYGAYRAGFNPTRAALLSVVLVAVSIVLVTAEGIARGRVDASRVGGGAARRGRPVRLGRATGPAAVFVVVVLGVALAFPVVSVVSWSLWRGGEAVAFGEVFSALWATVGVSAIAALVTAVAALPVGLLAARYRGWIARRLEQATYVAHTLPGIVLAISMVYVGVRLLRPVYQELPLLALAYVVAFLPLLVGSVRAAVEAVPERLEDIARSLGTSRSGAWWRVTLPAARPGIAAGTALVFLATMKELPITLLLRPTGTETLATRLWGHTTLSDYSAAAPFALTLLVVAAVPTALLSGLLLVRGREDGGHVG
ncbi:MAG: iron ABC transporter permease [Actinobacteria bacterium]|nr:iron ABC transporter permease [Actinomycetota bacterium]